VSFTPGGPPPTDPFRLGAHLVDDHGLSQDAIDQLDSDTLRSVHAAQHDPRVVGSSGLPNHQHQWR
jgi:hypothetical protein